MECAQNPFPKVLAAVTCRLRAQQGPFLLAIDGACTAGKTTLAAALAQALQAPVFHMDDFYLPFTQRTPQRLQMPGGHMDWQRLKEEVLQPAAQGRALDYRAYDAHQDRWKSRQQIAPQKLYIVEGTYCLLPALEAYYNYKVFLTLNAQTQYKRLQKRESKEKLAAFLTRWIPQEARYFCQCDPASRADMVWDSSDQNN